MVGRPEAAIRRRAAHTRSKTGCGTCRIRHKRCDEGKPICSNCQTTGRICDGYVDPETGQRVGGDQRRTATVSRPQPSAAYATHLFTNQQEAHGFRYFELAVTAQLGITMNDNSWTMPTLQVAHSDMALRQACVAVGILSKRYEINEVSVLQGLEDTRLARAAQFHYRKAAVQLQRQLAGHDGVAMTPEAAQTCHSFLGVFNFLQGNPQGVLHHLSCAIRTAAAIPNPNELQKRLQSVLKLMEMAIMRWLDLDWTLSSPSIESPDFFTNRHAPYFYARTTLEALNEDLARMGNEIMSFRQVVASSRNSNPNSSSSPARTAQVKELFQSRLDLWYKAFLQALQRPRVDDESFRRPLLHANYLMLVLRVDQVNTDTAATANATPSPLVPDQNLHMFSQIIDLAVEAWTMGGPTKRYDRASGEKNIEATGLLPLYAFRICFIRPLFYVGLRAPSVPVRWRAIEFLLEKPWREGAWDSAIMGSIAKSHLISELSCADASMTNS